MVVIATLKENMPLVTLLTAARRTPGHDLEFEVTPNKTVASTVIDVTTSEVITKWMVNSFDYSR